MAADIEMCMQCEYRAWGIAVVEESFINDEARINFNNFFGGKAEDELSVDAWLAGTFTVNKPWRSLVHWRSSYIKQ